MVPRQCHGVVLSAALATMLATTACDEDEPAGTGGSGGQGQGGGTVVQCDGASPNIFPTFDKSCTDSAECVMKEHMIDCCGSLLAVGINASAEAAFDAAEAECQSQYPGCGCAPGPTLAEDGNSAEDGGSIALDCSSGSCSTVVR